MLLEERGCEARLKVKQRQTTKKANKKLILIIFTQHSNYTQLYFTLIC